MKVLIDDGLSIIVKLTGIGYQAVNLYKHLAEQIECKISNYGYLKIFPRYFRRLIYIIHSNIRELLNEYDVIHYQNYYVPLIRGKAKKIVTIHDLAAFKYPETLPKLYSSYNRRTIIKALKRADAIITPSVTIKKEILEFFGSYLESKIYPCDDGIRNEFLEHENDRTILKKNGILPYSYYFFLGSISPRKNVRFVIDSFLQAKRSGMIKDEIKLVLGGQFWWDSSDCKNLISKNSGILTTGYIKEGEIVELYKNCICFVFPSIYEGFGMPLIEAMSQNIPIVISNIPTSVELNENHNKQMFVFELGNQSQLIDHFVNIEKNQIEIRATLNYGDLSRYYFDSVVNKHFIIYEKLFFG